MGVKLVQKISTMVAVEDGFDPHPARKSAPTSPFQGEVSQMRLPCLEREVRTCATDTISINLALVAVRNGGPLYEAGSNGTVKREKFQNGACGGRFVPADSQSGE